jgi:hypothetical protein
MAPKQKKQRAHEDNPAKGEWIRRFKANPFVFIGTIVILIIVIVAFVVVPAMVPETAGPTVDLNFGSYNKVPITYVPGNFFANTQASLTRLYQNYFSESDAQSLSQLVWRRAFEDTVLHIAQLQEIKQAGYVVPEAVVDREVATLPQFQENGRFSVSRWERLDRISRLTLWREVQESIARSRYLEDMMSLRIPSAEEGFIRNMTALERSFGLAVFPLGSYPNEEIQSYAASAPDLFRVTHLSRITINSSEREAQQVLDSIKDGTKTFEEAAQTQSQDTYADRSGEIGIRMAYELISDIPDSQERESVITTPPGDYSPVVKVPTGPAGSTGWAFFRAEEAVYPADTTDTANLDKIRSYMNSFERGRIEDWLFEQARLFISAVEERGFDTAQEEWGMEKRDFGPLPLNYGGVTMEYQGVNQFPTLSAQSISELIPAGTNENFWRAAFFTPLGSPSEPLVISNNEALVNVVVLYPQEETTKDPADTEGIAAFYSTWISSNAETSLRSHFITNEKLEDKFFQTYLQYFILPN